MFLKDKLFRSAGKQHGNVAVQVLFRPGCHLCDDAEIALVKALGRSNVQPVNILESRELEDAYVFRIPVVLYEGRLMAEGIIGDPEARQVKRKVRQLARDDGASR
jgi:hypothetical protein